VVLDAQVGYNHGGSIPTQKLGISESALNSANTLVFKNALEAMQLLADPDVQAIMQGRMKKYRDELWESTRSIRAAIKEL